MSIPFQNHLPLIRIPLVLVVLISFPFFTEMVHGQTQEKRDSLLSVAQDTTIGDSLRGSAFHDLAWSYVFQYPDSAIHFAKMELKFTEEKGLDLLRSHALNTIGVANYFKGNYPRALENYQESARLRRKFGKKVQVGSSYNNIALIHDQMDHPDQALENHRKALGIFRELKDSVRMGQSLNNIGIILMGQGQNKMAMEKFKEVERMIDKMGPRVRANTFNNIGLALQNEERSIQAKNYFLKAKEIYEQTGDNKGLAGVYRNLGEVSSFTNDLSESLEWCKKGYEIAKEQRFLEDIAGCSKCLSTVYDSLGDHKRSLEYLRKAIQLIDTLHSKDKSNLITRKEMRFQFEKKELKDSLENARKRRLREVRHQQELERQRTLTYAGGIGVLLLAGLGYFLFRGNQIKKKKNRELSVQKEIVDEKNKEITDSIHYASRIQSAILTAEDYMKKHLGDHFVLFRPKEAVSGDFYWAFSDGDHAIWVAADCTGHGVPGAFMSMIGNRLFNEVVVEQAERDPGIILDKIRDGIIKALGQSGDEDTKDGMDAALCILDKKEDRLHFAGANNPLYVITNLSGNLTGSKDLRASSNGSPVDPPEERFRNLEGENGGSSLIEIKGDKQPIAQPEGLPSPFTSISFKVDEGDRIYTFSDGFADQFGGEKGKKYRYKPFKKLLLSIADKPMTEQRKILEKEFEDWKGDREQIDDLVVIGVRV